jgi:hypothetical protein
MNQLQYKSSNLPIQLSLHGLNTTILHAAAATTNYEILTERLYTYASEVTHSPRAL